MPFLNRLVRMTSNGTALTNSTSATSLLHASGKLPLPAGPTVWQKGGGFKIFAAGRMSTVTTPGTMTIDLKVGSVVIVSTGAMVLSTTAKTNVTWELELDLTVLDTGGGTACTVMAVGTFKSEAFGATTVAGEAKVAAVPATAPAASSGFDDTASQTFDLFGTWSIANANSIQAHVFDVHNDAGL